MPSYRSGRSSSVATLTCVVLAVFLSLGLGVVLPAPPARAQSPLVVSSTADSGPNTLRQAILDAASGSTVTFAPGLSGATITLEEPLVLAQDVTIDGSALEAPVTISGDDAVRILDVPAGVAATLAGLRLVGGYSGTNDQGGAITNAGTLTVSGCTLGAHNAVSGGAILSTGVLDIRDSVLADNDVSAYGGAIQAADTLTVTRCTFLGNWARYGGAIELGGGDGPFAATIRDSTFALNRANAASDGEGGAVRVRYAAGVTLEITNSTLVDSLAQEYGGAVLVQSGTATLTHVTIHGSYAASVAAGVCVLGPAQATLVNCIVTGSQGSPDVAADWGGSVDVDSHANLVGGDALLGPLAMNGGPTETMALLEGSPALDAGEPLATATADQRGVTRPQGAGMDLGAYEARPPTAVTAAATAVVPHAATLRGTVSSADGESTVVFAYGVDPGTLDRTVTAEPPLAGADGVAVTAVLDDLIANATYYYRVKAESFLGSAAGGILSLNTPCVADPVVTDVANDGPGTLRRALEEACDGAAITFAPDLSGQTITLEAVLVLTRDVTIDGAGLAAPVTLSGGQTTRVLFVAEDVEATLRGLTIADGYVFMEPGAGIASEGALTVEDCTVRDHVADGGVRSLAFGGGIASDGVLTVTRSTFTGNEAATGGAIAAVDTLVVRESTLTHNRAEAGGAIANIAGGSATVTDATLAENDAVDGGALLNEGSLTLSGCAIEDNTASGRGAGLYSGAEADGVTVTMSECAFSGNVAGGDVPDSTTTGGAIYASATQLTATDCTFTGNRAGEGGAIVSTDDSAATLTDCDLVDNVATIGGDYLGGAGGAILSVERSSMTLAGCTLTGNRATGSAGVGGAIVSHGDLRITACDLHDNSATVLGGAIMAAGSVQVTDSTLAANSVGYVDDLDELVGGGALCILDAEVSVTGSTITGNEAPMGGAILNLGELTLANSTVAANTATHPDGWGGGGLLNVEQATVRQATFAGNAAPEGLGGGITNGGPSFSLANTIVAGSTGGDCLDLADTGPHTGSLIQDGSCDAALTGDPLLGPLADNGGPTETMALLAGSPALDAGDADEALDADQRGVARPQGALPDIGAYELRPPAAAITEAATDLTPAGATLWGAVTAADRATAAFEYGLDGEYGAVVAATPGEVSGTEVAVSAAVEGLLPNTTYHYRLVAENEVGTVHGQGRTLTTAKMAPTAVTGEATALGQEEATLQATVNAHNDRTTVQFRYGTAPGAYDGSAAAEEVTGLGDTPVSATIAGLLPNTVYYYRVEAANGGGTTLGEEKTFRTDAAPPVAITAAVTDLTATSVTLQGRVNARGAETRVTFQYARSTDYASGWEADADPQTVTGMAETPVQIAVSGLLPNTTYHYRVVAESIGGTVTGEDRTFTTGAPAPTVATGGCMDVTATTARLTGTANGHGLEAWATFEFGETAAYGQTAGEPRRLTGDEDTSVQVVLEGLAPGTTYHYRLVAESDGGVAHGEDRTFTTEAPAAPPHRVLLPLVQR